MRWARFKSVDEDGRALMMDAQWPYGTLWPWELRSRIPSASIGSSIAKHGYRLDHEKANEAKEAGYGSGTGKLFLRNYFSTRTPSPSPLILQVPNLTGHLSTATGAPWLKISQGGAGAKGARRMTQRKKGKQDAFTHLATSKTRQPPPPRAQPSPPPIPLSPVAKRPKSSPTATAATPNITPKNTASQYARRQRGGATLPLPRRAR